MLRMDLLELLNSGRSWAFVGSGVSGDAGCPSWQALVDVALNHFDPEIIGSIRTDPIFTESYQKKDFAECLSRIEYIGGRPGMEEAIRQRLNAVMQPGRLSSILADWPFAGYITTNYDSLLEVSLRKLGQLGWMTAGNTQEEVRKLSGDPSRVVWHIHGALDLVDEKSELVLTSRDYDNYYLDDSPMVKQLRALLSQRRAIFIGFGFQDQEVMRLLKLVGRLSNPAQPAFAFLHGLSGMENRDKRIDLLEKYNVDVIPYEIRNHSHRQLIDLLETYGSMVLRRTQRFGQPARACPSYDPETTSLLIYNNLALRNGVALTADVLGSLVKVRILSLLQHRERVTVAELVDDIRERAAIIGKSVEHANETMHRILRCLDEAAESGDVKVEGSGEAATAFLTPAGVERVGSQAGVAQRTADQFSSSIIGRVNQRYNGDSATASRIAQCAETFLKESVARRALGVAMVWQSPQPDYRSYHMVALLQSLPDFMAQLSSIDEAKVLVGVITDILSNPSQAEKEYLGLLLQAQFGLHLLGYHPDTLEVRARELASTLFLVDADSLIAFLARSSAGSGVAHLLISKLLDLGAVVGTTSMLADEVVEHARWPIDSRIVHETGQCTLETIKAANGRAGYRSNAFLEGFLHEASSGKGIVNYLAYLQVLCNCQLNSAGKLREAFGAALLEAGVRVYRFGEWTGFASNMWEERSDLAEQIAQLRLASNTYRHERQVQAEAEALIIANQVRSKQLSVEDKTLAHAYFISRTRVIDSVAGPAAQITMQPEAVLQWLATLSPCPPEDLAFLVHGLIWELSERGFAIVDPSRLRVIFSPLITAARNQLQEELQTHQLLISERYGENAARAFREAADVDLPVVMESYYAQRNSELEQELLVNKSRLTEMEIRMAEVAQRESTAKALRASKPLTEDERRELERLRVKEKSRVEKQLRRKRRNTRGQRSNRRQSP